MAGSVVEDSSVSAIRLERRSRARYPVRLTARYRTLDRPDELSGVGTTVNMSSTSLMLRCRHAVPFGARVEVLMNWPSLLEANVPLQLVTLGRVVRTESSSFVIEFARYQFRTMRTRPLPKPFALEQSLEQRA